jgi:mono/diheme cytochrome c family protein
LTLLLGLGLLAGSVYLAGAESLQQTAADGEANFNQKCAACHTIGGGKLVGPDLQGVTARQDTQWLHSFIENPDAFIKSGDPTAVALLAEYNNFIMPTLGLTDTEIQSVIAYLETQAGEGQAAPSAPAVVLPPGDPASGRRIFRGENHLFAGGPACIACHTTNDLGGMQGGTLGPDLTNVATRFGDTGLASALSTLPFPTMQGPFGTRPLTPQEQADLHAYFLQTQSLVPVPRQNIALWFLLGGVSGGGLLFAIMLYFWPRQRTNLAEMLRRNS